MAIDEVRMRLRQQLEEMLGVDEAALLMDRPPGGWSDLATKQDLDRRFAEQDARFDLKLEALEQRLIGADQEVMSALHREIGGVQQELRAQTWRLVTAVLTAMSVLTAVFGLLVVLAAR